MKKLTDEMVARALGWTKRHNGDWYSSKHLADYEHDGPPEYTTDLNVIFKVLKEKGLYFDLGETAEERFEEWFVKIRKPFDWNATVTGPTAPLALCAALLAYLKEKP